MEERINKFSFYRPLHERAHHVVTHEAGRDLLEDELVRRQPRPLVVRPRLCAEGLCEASAGVQRTDDAEGGAVARGGERAGVAVGEDTDFT